MQHYAKKAILITLAMTLSACTYIYGDKGVIKNRNTDYLKARRIAPLQIPPGMSTTGIHETYPVSNKDYPGATREISLAPPGL